MFDLCILDPNEIESLKKTFPEAKVDDANDVIHLRRYSIVLPNDKEKAYLFWLFDNKLLGCSYTLMDMRLSDLSGIRKLFKEYES